MADISISPQTARRFVLGLQGLWPGRRWYGKPGTETALQEIESAQLDPLNVVARSQDLLLHSRVVGYRPEYLNDLIYKERKFFDYGGNLQVYPITEFPYWRLPMQRRASQGRWGAFAASHPELLDEVRARLRSEGPVSNRDFEGGERVVGNYRGRKESSLALYYLWLTGEIMVHHRQGFQRFYDFTDRILPPNIYLPASDQAAEDHFAQKTFALYGLLTAKTFRNVWASYLERKVSPEDASQKLAELLDAGEIFPIKREASNETWYTLARYASVLSILESGNPPEGWKPLETTTLEEVTFLAPLDIVSARGRAKGLFGFEYLWEVYKPAPTRRWGYYTLPILYGDQLVARMDPKLERSSNTLMVKGFWAEEDALLDNPDFILAFTQGLARFMDFLGATRLDLSAISPGMLQQKMRQELAVFSQFEVVN